MNKIDGYENQNREESKKMEEKRVKAKENASRHTVKDKPTWLEYAIKHFNPTICYWTNSFSFPMWIWSMLKILGIFLQ